ncbi:MAG: hypothetical protein OCC45_15745, partial [Desulfotalea sp.]
FFTLFLCTKSIARSCCLVLGTSGESTSLLRLRQLFSFTDHLFSISKLTQLTTNYNNTGK